MDIKAAVDRGESPTRMEPMIISAGSKHREELIDLAMELVGHSTGFLRSLPTGTMIALTNLVRSMNCYYSNLIEGHNTHPIDIERSLKNDYSSNTEKRNLQLEAKAHIEVQKWIDEGGLQSNTTTTTGICDIHRRFSELLPEALLLTTNLDANTQAKVIPGQLRQQEVRVGNHIAVSPGAIPRFMERFELAYSKLGTAETILAAAAAHHRLLWIHPFLDGNGRVARLMSHAMLLDTLGTGGVWSVARGLAQQVQIYKSHLANCDLPRKNDLDGRGNLSEEALAAFTRFFLETCLDQVKFMEELVQPKRLRARILLWAEEEMRIGKLPNKASTILEVILFRGEIPRSEVSSLLGISDRQARRIISALSECEAITSTSTRSPLQIKFPAKLAARWLPGLFPE